MSQFLIDNKEILSLSASVLGILLALGFGGIRSWRNSICLNYESRRKVAINILRDKFIQKTSAHFVDVADEQKREQTEVTDIYKRPEQQSLIRELAKDLEDQNRVRRRFKWLDFASQASFGFIWFAIIIVIIGISSIWFNPPSVLVFIWTLLLGFALVGFIVSVSVMWFLDGWFFSLVHRIIEAEGE